MGIVNRGFFGRRRQQGAGLIPPGQYLVDDFPVLSAGPTPHDRVGGVGPHHPRGRRLGGRPLDVGRAAGPAARGDRPSTSTASPSGRSSARTGRACRSTRCWRASTPAAELVIAFSDGGYTTNLPLADVHGRAGVGGGPATTARTSSPSTADRPACWCPTSTSGRARSGCAACSSAWTTSRASGRASATTTTAIRGASSATGATDPCSGWSATVTETDPRDRPNHDPAPRRAGLAGPSGRAARRRPPDCRGRLPGPAELLDRVGARGRPRRADRGPHRRRRGVALPDHRRRRRRPARAARARSGAGSCGTATTPHPSCWSAAAQEWCR